MERWNSNVAEKFKATYFKRGKWDNFPTFSPEEIYAKIIAVNGDLDKIQEIIGNNSWTNVPCTNCDVPSRQGVVFDNGDGDTCHLCKSCLQKGLDLCS